MADHWRQLTTELEQLAKTANDAGEFARIGYQASNGQYITVDPANPMYVWVRIGGDPRYPARANNAQGVPPDPDLPVRVGFPPGKRELHILGLAEEATAYYDGRLPGIVGPHTHEVGTLWDPVSARRLKMGRVKAHQVNGVYGMEVYIEPHYHAGGWWPGGTIDLADYTPDAAGFHRWVKVGMDEAENQPVAYPGDLLPKALPLTESQLATVPMPTGIAYAGVKLVYGDVAIDQESRFADCTPWRSRGAGGSGSGTFVGLSDTPASYADRAGYLVVVNPTATGLEFVEPGGEGGAWNPNLPPASPSAYDDEFDDDSVDAKWAEDDPSSKLSLNESGEILHLELAFDNGAGAGLWQDAPAGDWQTVVKITPDITGDFPSQALTNTKIGIAAQFSDGAICSLTHSYLFPASPPYFMLKPSISLLVSGGGYTVAQFIDATEFYLRLRYDSATKTFSGQYSTDGITWHEKTLSYGVAVEKIGLYASNRSEHVIGAKYDFFRVREEYGSADDPIYGNSDAPLAFGASQISYDPADGSDWPDPDPANVQAALDKLAARETGGAALTIKESDGTPAVSNVDTIVVTNGTLTDDGSGQVTLDLGSTATDSAAIHADQSGEIAALTEKGAPVNTDLLIIEDSAAGNAKKKVQIANLPSGAPAFSGAQVSRTDQPTAPYSTYTIPWNVARFDTDNYWDDQEPSRLTAPVTGYYQISMHVRLQDAADTDGYMVAVVSRTMANPAQFVGIADTQMSYSGDSTGPSLQSSGVWRLEAGDYIELTVTHYNASGNKLVACGLTMVFMGA